MMHYDLTQNPQTFLIENLLFDPRKFSVNYVASDCADIQTTPIVRVHSRALNSMIYSAQQARINGILSTMVATLPLTHAVGVIRTFFIPHSQVSNEHNAKSRPTILNSIDIDIKKADGTSIIIVPGETITIAISFIQ
jgi:hypothetical protein